jgi:TetR/AcrR family transcriptional regulator
MAVAVTSKPKKLAPLAKAKTPLEPLRDAQRTRQALLAAAEIEFSTKGLAGARVDVIAEQAAANKRMLYYYFGSKEDLYLAVLERAYGAMRETERQLNLTNLEPLEAIRTLVEFKFDYCQEHQQIIALLAGENMLGAVHLKRSRRLREINLSLVDEIRTVLDGGVAKGEIKPGLDPVHLYISMSALSYFYFSNSATLSAAFGRPLASAAEQKLRRAHCVDVIMSYITTRCPHNAARQK